jgi:ribonuclease P protein subunit RPR2
MKDRLRKKKRDQAAELAAERIDILFNLAEKKAAANDMESANSLVKRAFKIALKFNVRIPKVYKYRFCKHCLCFLLPGKTSKARVNSKARRVEVECLNCNKKTHHPYGRK